MTVEELIIEVFEQLGEPTDIYIYDSGGAFDLTEAGSQKILKALNWGQDALIAWKDTTGTRVQFRGKTFIDEEFVEYEILEGTVQAGSTENSVVVEAAHTGLENHIIVIGSQVGRVVVSSTGVTLYVGKAFDTTPLTGDTYTLYPRSLGFSRSAPFQDILAVYDMENSNDLSLAARDDLFPTTLRDIGNPSEYIRNGNKLYFNQAPESTRYFKLTKYRNLIALTTASQESELPYQFHYGLVWWVMGWGMSRMQEISGDINARRSFKDFMRSTQTEYEFSGKVLDDQGELVLE